MLFIEKLRPLFGNIDVCGEETLDRKQCRDLILTKNLFKVDEIVTYS